MYYVAPGDTPADIIVGTLNVTAIHIQWSPPLTPNGIIIFYTIYINDIPLLNVSAGSGIQNISVGGFFPHQMLNVRLSASTKAGEGLLTEPYNITTHESGTFLPSVIPHIYQIHSAVPSQVENLQVVALTPNSLSISWNPPTYPNGVLTGYTVLVENLINSTAIFSSSMSFLSTTIKSGVRKLNIISVSFTRYTHEELLFSIWIINSHTPTHCNSVCEYNTQTSCYV